MTNNPFGSGDVMRLRRLLMFAVPLLLVSGLFYAPTAYASPDDTASGANRLDTAIGRANPDVPQEVIDGLPTSILDRSDIWVDPDVPADTVWLTTEGEPFKGQSPEQVQKAASCRWSGVSPAFTSGLRYNAPCGYIGTDSSAKISYTRTTDPNSNGTSCWQARYYAWRIDNTWQERWIGAGCYDRTIVQTWGPVASTPAVILSNSTMTGWAGAFVV